MRGKTLPISSHLAVFFTRLFGGININPTALQMPSVKGVFFSFKNKRRRIFHAVSQNFILAASWISASHVYIFMWIIACKKHSDHLMLNNHSKQLI